MRIMPKKTLAMASMDVVDFFAKRAKARDREAREDRYEQNLQQVTFGKGAHERVRNDCEQVELCPLL